MSDFSLIELDYNTSLIECYQKLARLPGFILLESTNQTLGRYDLVSAFPYDLIKVQSEEDYKTLHKYLESDNLSLDLPFQGGLMGYFSYDFAARLAGIKSQKQPSLEKIPDAQLGAYDWAIIAKYKIVGWALVHSRQVKLKTSGHAIPNMARHPEYGTPS